MLKENIKLRNKFIAKCIVLAIFWLIQFSYSDASADSNKSIISIIGNDIQVSINDGLSIGNSLVNIDNEWLRRGTGIIGAGGFGMMADEPARNLLAQNQSNDYKTLANIGNNYGNALYAVAFSGLVYCGGLVSGDEGLRTTGRMMIESLVYSGIITQTLKFATGRARPYLNKGNINFNYFKMENDYYSFPSGHTTVAFALSSVLATRINTWWAYATLYPLAGLTGYARIYKDMHWLSDVIVSAFIGTSVGTFIVNRENKKDSNTQGSILIYPTLEGIGMAYRF